MRRACCLANLIMLTALAGPDLHLKTRVIPTTSSEPNRAAKSYNAAAASSGKGHLLIQFDHVPGQLDAQSLSLRGAVVTGYVHENGLVVATESPAALMDLGLQWMGRLEPADKISPMLTSSGAEETARPVLVEFHSDVNVNDGRGVVLQSGMKLADNPDLVPHHVLASASASQIAAIAERDEVAYVFPASKELQSGEPLTGCTGALTDQGATGQYIAKIGEGWDGPGKNPTSLGYYFSDLTEQLPADSVRSEILRAFSEWAKYIHVTFAPASRPDGAQTINVLFGRLAHGDAYAFDGPGGVLAHTFYPAPPNPEPLAGDMHFDDDEYWRTGSDKDLFSVALHEAGHALGLAHSDRPGAVMYPYYAQVTELTADDIAAIRDLYASNEETVTIPAIPAEPAPTPAPFVPTVPATPTPSPSAPKSPLAISVGQPAAATAADGIKITGSVSGGSGTIVVSWRTDRGQSGLAQGSAAWSAQVPLSAGVNLITVSAQDSQRTVASGTVSVARQIPAAAPVAIQVEYPAGTGVFTSVQPQISLHGTASHGSGVQSVRWTCARGPSGVANGTASWDTGAIALQDGVNNVTIQVTAKDGSTGMRVVQITYSPSGHDTTAPAITITSPSSVTPLTSDDSIVMRGTASDNVGVIQVTWFTSAGASGEASGTTNWTTPSIPLVRGYNSIVIRAFDAAGNAGWRMVNVTKQ